MSLLLFLKGGCVSTRVGSTPSFCCSERRHAAITTAGVSSIWSGYSPPRPRRCGCSSSKVDNRFLDLTGGVSKKLFFLFLLFKSLHNNKVFRAHAAVQVAAHSIKLERCMLFPAFLCERVWAGWDRKLNLIVKKIISAPSLQKYVCVGGGKEDVVKGQPC